jgi:hypothetical protein
MVFFDDDMTKISSKEAKLSMYQSLGLLVYRHPIRIFQAAGTAFLISPNIIITSAHNVYRRK